MDDGLGCLFLRACKLGFGQFITVVRASQSVVIDLGGLRVRGAEEVGDGRVEDCTRLLSFVVQEGFGSGTGGWDDMRRDFAVESKRRVV